MPTYSERTRLAQIALLRPFAREFAAEFGLANARIRLATHAYNTTFRLDHPSGTYALRINVNSDRAPEHIRTEVAWLESLAAEGAPTLRLRQAQNGESIVMRPTGPLGRPLMAVCSHWIGGRRISMAPTDRDVREVGQLTARLHRSRPILPSGAVPAPDSDTLMGIKWALPDHGFRSAALEDALALSESALARLRTLQPVQLIHYDLHQGNLKRSAEGLIVLDFDDCRLSPPFMDCAITHYYMRGIRGKAIDKPYFQGLGYLPSNTGLTDKEFECLVFGRRIMLANAFFTMVLSDWLVPEEYARETVSRAEQFMQTFVYDPPTMRKS